MWPHFPKFILIFFVPFSQSSQWTFSKRSAHQTSVWIQRFPFLIHISSPSCSRNWMEQSLAEKVTIPKRIKECLVFYGTRRFIAVFTRARHLSVSRVRSIQFTLWNPVFQNSNACQSRSVLLCDILSTNLLHPSWIQNFPSTLCH